MPFSRCNRRRVVADRFGRGWRAGGTSLGVFTFDAFNANSSPVAIDVSGAFGGTVLSAFRLTGPGDDAGMVLASVSFTDAPPPSVPELTTLLLCAAGLAVGGYRRLRVRAANS